VSDLSIVIASYETAPELRACLRSIERSLAQGLDLDLDVIVVDNGSRDESVACALESALAPRVVASRRNRGFAAAMNVGLRLCRGRHVLLLNSDVEVDRALLEGAVARLDAEEGVGVLGPALVHSDGRAQRSVHAMPGLATELFSDRAVRWVSERLVAPSDRPEVGAARDVEAIRGAVFFLRAGCVEEVGLLDEGFFFFLEETDYCGRVREAGLRVVYCPSLVARHALGASSKRRAPLATRIEYHRSLYRFLSRWRGPSIARFVCALRAVRGILGLVLLSLPAVFSPRARARLAQRYGLLLWHLRGCPSEPTLADALARVPLGGMGDG
jgi:hypothetical protein